MDPSPCSPGAPILLGGDRYEISKYRLCVFLVCFLFFFWCFWLHCAACGILVPQAGVESRPRAVKALSPNHWTAREFAYVN